MSREVTDLTPYVKWVVLAGVLFVGGLIAMVVVLGSAAQREVIGPGEAHNLRAVDELVAELRAGRTPQLPHRVPATPTAMAWLRDATSRELAYSYGAFIDASHGTSCFDFLVTAPRGQEHILVTVDSDHGPPVVTNVAFKRDCTCRRTGRAYCSR